MLSDSDMLLNEDNNLLNVSPIDVDSDSVLKVFIKRDMLSPILVASDIDLNVAINRDTESVIETESDIVLNEDNSLEMLSVIEIDSTNVLNVDICLVTESVIAYVPAVISNGGVLKTRLSNFAPRSKICLIDDGLTIVTMPSPTAMVDSVIVLNVESNLLIESLTVIVLSVIVLKIA